MAVSKIAAQITAVAEFWLALTVAVVATWTILFRDASEMTDIGFESFTAQLPRLVG